MGPIFVNFLKRAYHSTFASRPRMTAVLGGAAVIAVIAAIVIWVPSGIGARSSVTIWGNSAPAELVSQSDSTSVELGTQFTAEADGTVSSVRFWKLPSQSGLHVGTLWTSTGTKLASAAFTDETAEGWQVAKFANPIALVAGRSYVVSYSAPDGGYAETASFTGHSTTPTLAVKRGAGVFWHGTGSHFPTHRWHNSQYWVDVVFAPGGRPQASSPTESPSDRASSRDSANPSDSPSPTDSPTPTSAATPSGSPTAAAPKPSAGFPSGSSTGVPAGTGLSAYAGPCTVTVASTVIDAKTINCSRLEIRAKNVTITRSVLNGTVYADPDLGIGSFTISDSQVNVGAQAGTGIGDGNFTALRVHVTGGNRSINCSLNCTVQASYVHGQFADHTGVYHESGIRIGSGSVLRGNTVACDAPDIAPDAGCSAAITGYGDFAIVQNDTIDGNLIIAGSGGYCTYGGSTTGKPYSTGTNNILYTNNVYQRGPSGKCGSYGPITSFDTTAPGNIWSNNTWDNGTPITAAD
jgi:hypothetical protein